MPDCPCCGQRNATDHDVVIDCFPHILERISRLENAVETLRYVSGERANMHHKGQQRRRDD